jgi:hypothetical protein
VLRPRAMLALSSCHTWSFTMATWVVSSGIRVLSERNWSFT